MVFNIELSIQDSIRAMIKEDIYCGLIWDTELNKFIGIFTIRDFLNLIKVIYEKVDAHLKSSTKVTNMRDFVASLFPSNKIDLEKLDEIMEDPDSIGEDSDMLIEEDGLGNGVSNTNSLNNEASLKYINENLQNYKEFFKIFKHININDYLTDIHPVKIV